jgi:NAD(P) transhydrogenase subunit alpha
MNHVHMLSNPYVAILTIFILACFVGYYVVWKVTPSLHTPLMSVTNAISSIIILGALIATGTALTSNISWLGGLAIFITSINIFGGFVVTQRMLSMYKK